MIKFALKYIRPRRQQVSTYYLHDLTFIDRKLRRSSNVDFEKLPTYSKRCHAFIKRKVTFVGPYNSGSFHFCKTKNYLLEGRVVKWEAGRGLNSKFHFLTNFTTTHFNQAQERCYTQFLFHFNLGKQLVTKSETVFRIIHQKIVNIQMRYQLQ